MVQLKEIVWTPDTKQCNYQPAHIYAAAEAELKCHKTLQFELNKMI